MPNITVRDLPARSEWTKLVRRRFSEGTQIQLPGTVERADGRTFPVVPGDYVVLDEDGDLERVPQTLANYLYRPRRADEDDIG